MPCHQALHSASGRRQPRHGLLAARADQALHVGQRGDARPVPAAPRAVRAGLGDVEVHGGHPERRGAEQLLAAAVADVEAPRRLDAQALGGPAEQAGVGLAQADDGTTRGEATASDTGRPGQASANSIVQSDTTAILRPRPGARPAAAASRGGSRTGALGRAADRDGLGQRRRRRGDPAPLGERGVRLLGGAEFTPVKRSGADSPRARNQRSAGIPSGSAVRAA